ncbi:OmpA family protein [Kaarinaea lacus]
MISSFLSKNLKKLFSTVSLPLVFLLLMAVSSTASAGAFCSDAPFNGTIDGSNAAHLAALGTQITIDTDCTFVNFPAGNELTVTLNFQTNDPSVYLITFDNVVFTGNMACANINHRIWFVNGADYGSKNNCQDLFIPVEAINKQNPPGTTTVGIGDPFTYTLRIPVLYDPVTGTYIDNAGSANDLHSITVRDDLNATGADLTLVGTPTVTWVGSGAPVAHTFTSNVGGVPGNLEFVIDPGVVIPAGDQIEIAITAVADATNTLGTPFVNTARWSFGRLIDIDGVPTFFDPLPGENGVTEPLTIGGPDLVVTKSSPDTALNSLTWGNFTIDVQNVGGARAWDATIVDILPDDAVNDAGMCSNGVQGVSAEIVSAGGVQINALTQGTDYSLSYVGCTLTLTMLTAEASIGPSERLVISYQAKLDELRLGDGVDLTNYAYASQWFSGDNAFPRTQFDRILDVVDPGTPLIVDHQDSHTLTTTLSGYVFQKTVQNITTGVDPATVASPGDTLRYRIRLFNFTYDIHNLAISDMLDSASFDLTSFNLVTPPVVGAINYNSATGLLDLTGSPTVNPGQELMFEFDINLLPTLTNGTSVSNQASFSADDGAAIPVVFNDLSDDPYVDGIPDLNAAPPDPRNPTVITIQAPGPLDKILEPITTTTATIGERITYRITVPAVAVPTPLYDVRILDNLNASAADMTFVSAVVNSGGTWTLSNSGTSTNLLIEDTNTGIDIPAGGQAVIDITVELQNTLNNQQGLSFTNSASYTYNRTNGDPGTRTFTASDVSPTVTIVEPAITTIVKNVNNATPSPGDTITYSVALTANGAGGFSDVFDVILTDVLPAGLSYVPGSSLVTAGAGVGADNSINDPDVTVNADGTETLVWGVIEADVDIQVGDTVTVSYNVLVDPTAIFNQSYTNSVYAQWSSVDGSSGAERDGVDGIGGLNDYVTSVATVDINTPPDALTKAITQSTAQIGDQFTYLITVPANPQSTALYDVRITDDLTLSAADMTFVSVARISGSQPWTPTNTGSATSLVIQDTTNGIDIPAGEQVTIEITVELSDTTNNIINLPFTNTATYTFNNTNNTPASQENGNPGTSGVMTIYEPQSLILSKTGPPPIAPSTTSYMEIGVPATFTLEVFNDGSIAGAGTAYDLTIEDKIPNPTPGGMCDTPPANIGARIEDGARALVTTLVENTDFTVDFVQGTTPSCLLTFTMLTPAAAIPTGHYLVIDYDMELDPDTPNNTSLENIAGAVEWFSGDTAGTGATGSIRTYTGPLTDGTTSSPDNQDAFTVVSDVPLIDFDKSVYNVTTSQVTTPGNPSSSMASPRDVLRYTITATNTSATVAIADLSITDDLGRLNSPAVFEPGTLTNINVTQLTADTSNSDPLGGTNGTGLLDVRNIALNPGETITIEFDVRLASVIDDGTVVSNQALLQLFSLPPQPSDDPNDTANADNLSVVGDEDPTDTLINSAPLFQVEKISDDLTGDPAILLPGDTLRYTLTVKNIGTEHSVNSVLQDSIPANTTYVAGSTTLNGVTVTDPATGVSPLEAGMTVNSPDTTTAGFMTADATATTTNVATIVFNVTIDAGTLDGTIIANQGYFNADGAGTSGPVPLTLSDDPATTIANDPTRDIVGSLPLIDAVKTATFTDNGTTPGVLDAGDTLHYTITITNYGGVDATGVTFVDDIPLNTTYVPNSATLNGIAVPDVAGGSPFLSTLTPPGFPVSSSDLTTTAPPFPGVGYLTAGGGTATITFDVLVDNPLPAGVTEISNQGYVTNNETPAEQTDADGIDTNGDQPTVVPIGPGQELTITKSVSVVGGGPALPNGQLEYTIVVTNISTVPATNVQIIDDLNTALMTYVPGSGTLNGLATGVFYSDPTLTANYATYYGLLEPGDSAIVRFRVLLNAGLSFGTTITNTGQVNWDDPMLVPPKMEQASVSIDIGVIPGTTTLSGTVWHDGNYNNVSDAGERLLENWNVDLYFNGGLWGTVTTNVNGFYSIPGIAPNYYNTDQYEIRFRAPGAGSNAAMLGYADSTSANTVLTAGLPVSIDGYHSISNIIVDPNIVVSNLNLPIEPDGTVYDSIVRRPVDGATLTLLHVIDAQNNMTEPVDASCFGHPGQQGQVTSTEAYYKFDLNFSDATCPPGGDYYIDVLPPPRDYIVNQGGYNESTAIPALTSITSTPLAPFSVPGCAGSATDAIPATADQCEHQVSAELPSTAIPITSPLTSYHLFMTLSDSTAPDDTQLYNNHIPLDPDLILSVNISKTTPLVNVTRGELVPYKITFSNTLPVPLDNLTLYDVFPPGFKYVQGSARFDGVATEPTINNQQLSWPIASLGSGQTHTVELLLIVGAGVKEGEYVNRAFLYSNVLLRNASAVANATVRVVPDPMFDCSDVIGKVYDDRNLNNVQDEGEPGIGGVRLATARGLLVTTDKNGRFHVTCAAVPNEDRGSNFILKLDERTLPTGYRVTTENPRVQRLTAGKMGKYNFAATVHHVVSLSVADGAFKSGTAEIRPQWKPRLGLLIEELRKKPSVLRITYLADVESAGLVNDRIATLREHIKNFWKEVSETDLEIEKEIFWRHGGPVENTFTISPNGVVDYVGSAFNRENFGEDTERQLPHGFSYTPWMQDPELFKKDDETKFETKQVSEKKFTTRKLSGLVPPILFKSGKADISEEYVTQLRDILNKMRDRTNVRLHFIGHTDNVKLRGELKRKYEDNMGLSKERAGTTAEFFQRALELPPESISYEGMGDTKPVADNKTVAGKAKNRRVEVEVWYDEVSEEMVDRKVEIKEDIKRIMVCRVETVCKLRYKEGHSRRTKLKNLVPPFHYDEGVSEIPSQYLTQLKQTMDNLASKGNVQMRFIAYTDNVPLTGRDERIYGDHEGLSKANARRVAIAVQEALGLPNAAIISTGRGSTSPIASNNSEKGRSLNRRIEVEFWHDDPLEDLPDEPQICPEASAAETVERVYNPPEGDIKPVYFENGKAVIPADYAKVLQRAMDDIKEKGNVRLRFIGYTSNKRLSRRTAMVYGDDIGLSTARARRAMQVIQQQMGLNDKQVEFEGRGYVQSHDVVNTGFVELDRSKVEVQVVYDELAVLDEQEGVSINRLVRDVETQNPFTLNLMRISVDGQPINDPNKNIPDVQRCTDVALDKAQVHFKFDNMQAKPRLNLTAWPNVISHFDGSDTEFEENLINFKLYTNYPWSIEKAEVRIFKATQSTRDTPLAVAPVDQNNRASWKNNLQEFSAPRMEFKYVLRVYDKQGNFDETAAQTFWVVDALEADNSEQDVEKQLLVGYGENRLSLNNIPLNGGMVRVYGKQVPAGHKVWFAGLELPVNDQGVFGGEYIIPSGLHTVEVSITDTAGNGNVYQRDLEIENSDWFYVGIADITASIDDTNGPADIISNDDDHYSNELSIDGRLAFYVKGKFENEAVLTASADTREGPIDEIFSNFMNKTPEALFRRIDPDLYYPTFGDDSTVEEDAPTSGKFYVKYQKDKNYGLWGNFDIAYLENNLAHVDRGLYGANANYESDKATSFGEKQYKVNVFAAEPGTIAGRDEFLGTGGSLYYLRHQDILPGSDRVRVETRDSLSGMVTSVKNLAYGLDYDIDYIQGRIILHSPLSATAASGTLVNAGDYGGTDVVLVARYEYTPGFDNLDDITTGGRAHYWFNDQVKLGLTIENQDYSSESTSLNAYDLTWRKNAGTWLKLEQGTSQGPVSSTLASNDGGFIFTESALAPGTDVKAKGQRLDASVRLEDAFKELWPGVKGVFTFYNQQLDAGYAAPGLVTQTDTTQTGGTLKMPVHEQVNLFIKADSKQQENGLKTEATEINADYLMDDFWTFSAGIRADKRHDRRPVVPLTQQEGERTDMQLRATFNSRQNWLTYGYIQGTTDVSGNRDDNDRYGVGADYRITDRVKLDGELSSGDLGSAIKLGTEYKMSDATNLYSSYALENERTDNGVRARRGNMTSGFKSRYSDSASIYMEERYTHGDVPTGLTHSMGFDLAITEALNFGANIDAATLRDNNTGAEMKRKALGARVGYKFKTITYAGAVEYRVDETEQADTSFAERKTWLFKNSMKYQLTPDWRVIAKLNHSKSESSLGDFYNGKFTEAVVGYAFRPVNNDSLNALFKYTYFYNLPSVSQVTGENTTAEYIQKSQIISLDMSYDLTQRWTVGGKYAHRFGELSLDRDNPQFFESDASLYIVRLDWHFTHRWDALIEGRLLDLPDAGDARSGFLVAAYRHLGEYIKFGVGYNFTDFSDDLTDLDYDSQGIFINAVGKF